ncbi:MAG: response regulator [Thermodesulfobacteria bacterium]|nr:response regulator [Thermodesulfobacteriota bacterium]
MANTKRVLVLDDEEMILELVTDIFKLMDFEVVSVTNSNEAIEEFKKAMDSGRPFDLVLFDMTLPGDMDGADVLREVRKLDPSIKAIVSSGYTQDKIKTVAGEHGFDAAVPKPYSISVLKETVQRLLKDS